MGSDAKSNMYAIVRSALQKAYLKINLGIQVKNIERNI